MSLYFFSMRKHFAILVATYSPSLPTFGFAIILLLFIADFVIEWLFKPSFSEVDSFKGVFVGKIYH